MEILKGKGPFPPRAVKPLLAVGNFDGVHLGHQRVFEETVSRASVTALSPAILTFSGHPLKTLRPVEAPMPVMTPEDRLRIARMFGFETAYVLDFDPSLASMSPEHFLREVLLEVIGAGGLVAGAGWRFGKGRKGSMELLGRLGREAGFTVVSVDPVLAGGMAVSSTRIRDLISAGDVAGAADLLGRPHFVRGVVFRGRGLGKGLGFPTVNLDIGRVLIPGDGIYTGAYFCGERVGPAALSIGKSPTFPEGAANVEAHFVGWEGDLYGETVTIMFFRRLRSQRAFPDQVSLVRQIDMDVKETARSFDPGAVKGVPR